MTKEKNIGVRLSAADLKKLDEIAAETFRPRSDVVRLLIAGAHASKVRDITFAWGEIPAAAGRDN